MFFNGKTYEIKRASLALQLAIRDYIRDKLPADIDGLQKYEAIEREANSLQVCAFMVKHLVVDFPGSAVTMEAKDFLLRMIHLRHVDEARESAIEQRDARRWHEAKEDHVSARVPNGGRKRVRKANASSASKKAAKVRPKKLRSKVQGNAGGRK